MRIEKFITTFTMKIYISFIFLLVTTASFAQPINPAAPPNNWQLMDRQKDGYPQFENDQLKGEVTSGSGEIFQIKELDRYHNTWYLTWHYLLIGNKGTHYIGTLTFSYWTRQITIGPTECN
jgi:hypothetical protein